VVNMSLAPEAKPTASTSFQEYNSCISGTRNSLNS
jgi:hypothetical protein